MSQHLSSSSPRQPLSIGNVVTAGVRLYSSNLKTYLRLALSAYLWALVPVYGWAKYAAISGLISRLAFGELINQPESIKTARASIQPRLWSFLRIIFQVGISLLLVYIALAIVSVVVGTIIAVTIGLILNFALGNTGTAIAVVLIAIIITGLVLFGLIWFYSRWVVAEVPLAIEENMNGGESVARSWDLTKTSTWRIQGIVLIAFIVTLPILILFSYLPRIFLLRFESGSNEYTIVYLISLIISWIGGVFVMPFWQAIKAVIYYDLRTRREGLGLQLRDRNI